MNKDDEILIDETTSDIKYDDQLYNYPNGITLIKSDVDRLSSNKTGVDAWLNDNLIDVLPTLLIKNVKGIKLSDCVIANCSATKNIFIDEGDTSRYFKKLKFNDNKFFIGMYAEKSHWSLCIAQIEEQLFYYIDPLIARAKTRNIRFDKWKVF